VVTIGFLLNPQPIHIQRFPSPHDAWSFAWTEA
jgi:hypothetical protein